MMYIWNKDFIIKHFSMPHSMACDTGPYPKQMRKMVDVIKRKTLQRIYDPINDTDQEKYRFKTKLNNLLKVPRLSVVIRIARLL